MTLFNHSKSNNKSAIIREVVFGMEDGMVSTLGAITGIAVGSQDQYTVLLAGCVIVAVESVSMGIGSYISNKVSKEVDQNTIEEEKHEIDKHPSEETEELYSMFVRDGWPEHLAVSMTKYAKLSKKLMLREMQYRELGISPYGSGNPFINAVSMYFAYIAGGFIPLASYFLLPIQFAIPISVVVTLCSLFVLGFATTRYTNNNPIRSGLRILILGGIALSVGYAVGELAVLLR